MVDLVPDVKNWWRFWSIRLGALGLSIVGIFEVFPDAATTIWLAIPADIKATFAPETGRYIGYAIIAAGLIARIIRQHRLPDVGAKGKPGIPGSDNLDGARAGD